MAKRSNGSKAPIFKYPDVQKSTSKVFSYRELRPNPLNPRRLFDAKPLHILEENIRKNGILVPLTVYREKNGEYYILDGQRRWTCAERIETDTRRPKRVPIPANVVDPPDRAANILYMFNIHNLREQWELMPTALSLKVLMDELQEKDDTKLAELTQLSEPNVKRCKVLLSFDEKYQALMLHPDPSQRIKANFFIEANPVLDLYDQLPKRYRGKKDRNSLTDHFLEMYRRGVIRSVIHFRRIMEAHAFLKDDEDKYEEFLDAALYLAEHQDRSIRRLFDPLVAENRSVSTAEELCHDFLKRMRILNIEKATIGRSALLKSFKSVIGYLKEVLSELEA